MARVFVSIGSNIQRYHHINNALNALQENFAPLTISPVYESEAVGFSGDNFLNLVVAFDTVLSVAALSDVIHQIEDNNGRKRSGAKFSSRTLDIDILLFDNAVGVVDGVTLPRGEILTNAFVLQPLADIAPNAIHPVEKKTFAQLWEDYDKEKQHLWVVAFNR